MAPQASKQRPLASRLPFFGSRHGTTETADPDSESSVVEDRTAKGVPKWSFGVLNDKQAGITVPGSVLLLADHRNEPLGMSNAPARTSHSSMAAGMLQNTTPREKEKKTTADGKYVLDPQPENSANDPLNWPTWRRDSALLSLGLYCMIGGGLTPILAAGFTNVAQDYGIKVSKVSLTTGLYMMGLGLGSVIASPTAILYGKRPVYLVSSILLIITSAWCALSPSFPSLILARIFQGVSVSPVECLPSATIAEIFFLHERAYRIGIYTLLLLGGKNLVPLVSAAVIQRLGWRWVFWIVVFVVVFCGSLLFVFVPETFWERAPVPKSRTSSRPNFFRRISSRISTTKGGGAGADQAVSPDATHPRRKKDVHFSSGSETERICSENLVPGGETQVKFAPAEEETNDHTLGSPESVMYRHKNARLDVPLGKTSSEERRPTSGLFVPSPAHAPAGSPEWPSGAAPLAGNETSRTRRSSSSRRDYLCFNRTDTDAEKQRVEDAPEHNTYSSHWREREAKSFVQQLRPYHGRLNEDNWLKVLIRPFILFSYPSVLWSAAVYSCSVGWLIVISESVAVIYRGSFYHFDALQTGLVYLSPFIGGVLGTAVAGKVSDIIVKAMARRNGGLYEPEFRLVMAVPIAITTVVGLMGFGWSAQVKDSWIVPTVFLGVVSFGCSLGSTTSITFCVDSYRQYAGEALVTLNFCKNIFHGLVFSLFVTGWITDDGPKMVFIWIGVIQLVFLVFTIPMFIYGKRARMWTVRKNLMEKF